MADTESEGGGHSTAPSAAEAADPLRRLRWRFFGALVLMGFLLGLMLGRLSSPEPARLLDVQVDGGSLLLRLSGPVAYREATIDGGYTLMLEAQGSPRAGHLQLDGQRVSWQLQSMAPGLAVQLVALRPLRVRLDSHVADEGWLLELRPEFAAP